MDILDLHVGVVQGVTQRLGVLIFKVRRVGEELSEHSDWLCQISHNLKGPLNNLLADTGSILGNDGKHFDCLSDYYL